VTDLKKKIQESQTFPVENQKLIYSGQFTVALTWVPEADSYQVRYFRMELPSRL
jgi:hypothetical protein